MVKKKLFFGIILITLLLTSLYGCLSIDYEGDLQNGYKVGKTSSLSFGIFSNKNGSGFSREYITGINVKGNIVFGKIDVVPKKLQRLVSGEKRHPGYFILDTKTDLYRLGLEKQEWLKELRKVGILEEPILIQPSEFRNEPALVTMIKAIILGQR